MPAPPNLWPIANHHIEESFQFGKGGMDFWIGGPTNQGYLFTDASGEPSVSLDSLSPLFATHTPRQGPGSGEACLSKTGSPLPWLRFPSASYSQGSWSPYAM